MKARYTLHRRLNYKFFGQNLLYLVCVTSCVQFYMLCVRLCNTSVCVCFAFLLSNVCFSVLVFLRKPGENCQNTTCGLLNEFLYVNWSQNSLYFSNFIYSVMRKNEPVQVTVNPVLVFLMFVSLNIISCQFCVFHNGYVSTDLPYTYVWTYTETE